MEIKSLVIKCSAAVTFLSLVVLGAVWAFTPPTSNPPLGNVDVPIHSGTSSQYKYGNLALNYGGSWEYGLVVRGKTDLRGDIEIEGSIIPKDNTYDLGASGQEWNNLHFNKGFFTTLDPIYKINNKKYATYVSDTIGLKAEVIGQAQLDGRKLVIDLSQQPEGSDLWLFNKIVKKNTIIPFVSPQADASLFGYMDGRKFIIEASEEWGHSKNAKFSYRLAGERIDNTATSNLCSDQSIQPNVDIDAISVAYLLTVTKVGNGTGTVSSAPAGITCGATCLGSFAEDSSVVLSAIADASSTFVGWSGSGCSGTGTCTVAMSTAKAVTATFNIITPATKFKLTVNKVGTGTGEIKSNPAGIICGWTSWCHADFPSGSTVTLTADPNTNSIFSNWSGACTGTSTVCTVVMNEAKTATATFNKATYTLTVSKIGTGTVTSTDAGINCGATCTKAYERYSLVTLKALPGTGYVFSGWAGDCSGKNDCTISMTKNKSVVAVFVQGSQPPVPPTSYTLTITKAGTGTGTITSNPVGINCGSTCFATFATSTSVVLSATSTTESTFIGWSGSGCSGTGTCTVAMNGNKTVIALFSLTAQTNYPLVVTKTGSGKILSTPTGIDCGRDCVESFSTGTTVVLTVQPSAGYIFQNWSGACSGTSLICSVTMDAAKSVTANFGRSTYNLTIAKVGSGTGTVISTTDQGINCGSDCSEDYTQHKLVTLRATAAAGSRFVGWAGDCSSSTNTCNVTMSSNKVIYVIFGN